MGIRDLGVYGFRDLNLKNSKSSKSSKYPNSKKNVTTNKIKIFRKTLAHLWADVQACDLMIYTRDNMNPAASRGILVSWCVQEPQDHNHIYILQCTVQYST